MAGLCYRNTILEVRYYEGIEAGQMGRYRPFGRLIRIRVDVRNVSVNGEADIGGETCLTTPTDHNTAAVGGERHQ